MNWIPIVKLGAWLVVITTSIAYLTIVLSAVMAALLKQKVTYAINCNIQSQLGYFFFGVCLGILLYL